MAADGMEEKATEFRAKGGAIYLKAD